MTTRYQNNGGSHTTELGVNVPNKGIFTSNDDDLCTKFPGKFVVLEKTNEAPEEEKTKAPEDTEEEDKEVDVTSDFSLAVENNLTVTKGPKGWTVYDEGEAITDKPVKKKDVDATITEFVG